MNRRTTLALTGGTLVGMGLSGCIGAGDEGDEPGERDDTGSELEADPDVESWTMAVTAYDEVPDGVPLSIDLTVTDDTIAADGPGYFVKTIENTHDDAVDFERIFYKGWSSEAGDPGILVSSVDAPDAPSPDEAVGCITGDESVPSDVADMTDERPQDHRNVEPGAVVEIEYIVADDWSSDGCFPEGTYRFEDDREVTVDGESKRLLWGFTLEIRRT